MSWYGEGGHGEDPWDFVVDYVNDGSLEVVDSNPTMLPGALCEKGIEWDWLRLV